MTDIRLLLTYDFFGSFGRQATSWGQLPGGSALRATVNRLREDVQTSAWIDVGDFSAGGPLCTATEGVLGWAAAASLGFDAAIPGNHEFDFGDAAVLTWAQRIPFPLVAADPALVALGPVFQPYWTVSSPSGRTVAIVGINLAERRGRAVYDQLGDLDAAAQLTIETAAGLRGQVDHTFVAIHDGIFPRPGEPDGGQRMRDFCRALRGHVDGVFGAHVTATRRIGTVAGMPYIQPWAMGVEVGVVDIDDDGIHLRGELVTAREEDRLGWSGPGSNTLAELRGQIIGELERPLTEPAMPGAGLIGDAVARGVLELTGADVAIVGRAEVSCGQVPLDGIHTFLPAGRVSEADLFRTLPWPGGTRADETWAAELSAEEVELLRRGLDLYFTEGCHCAPRRAGHADGLTVLSSMHVRNARTLLARDVDWQPTGIGMRDGLRAWFSGRARSQAAAHRPY
ncbi:MULTISPECIES: bifunctional UDP-sugar hydrolase/5'-nucleotidase [unclassified Frankia]